MRSKSVISFEFDRYYVFLELYCSIFIASDLFNYRYECY